MRSAGTWVSPGSLIQASLTATAAFSPRKRMVPSLSMAVLALRKEAKPSAMPWRTSSLDLR